MSILYILNFLILELTISIIVTSYAVSTIICWRKLLFIRGFYDSLASDSSLSVFVQFCL